MSKGQRSKILIVVFVTIALMALMVFTTLPESSGTGLSSSGSLVLGPIQKFFISIKTTVTDYFLTSRQNRTLRSENERLQEDNVRLRLQIKENEKAAEAYTELKQAFKLRDRFIYADFQAAHVLNGGQENAFDLIRLDLGKTDGIITDSGQSYAVVDANARLFGRIYSSDLKSSKVLTPLHEGFAVSCRSGSDQRFSFRLRGDNSLKTQGYCLADQIPAALSLKAGDIVYSSGLGGLFPDGLEIGQVIELRPQDSSGLREAVIKPTADYERTTVLFVIMGDRSNKTNPSTQPGTKGN